MNTRKPSVSAGYLPPMATRLFGAEETKWPGVCSKSSKLLYMNVTELFHCYCGD
jgi:hypothetical protein